MHGDNAYVTLTYSEENLPVALGGKRRGAREPSSQMSCASSGTLVLEDVQNWMKRLRKAIEPVRIRYYVVGEYGDENHRPHYHAAIFGLPSCQRGTTMRDVRGRPVWSRCCDQCRLVGDTWGKGDVVLGVLEKDSCQYVCGYVTKKLTSRNDERLFGRYPEFAVMSRRPGS